MDSKIETDFVKTFIVQSVRERFLFELLGKKREKALSRLSHNVRDILKDEYISNIDTMEDLLNKIGTKFPDSDITYVIGGHLDGNKVHTLKAIQSTFQQTDASLLIFNSSLAFIKEENEGGHSAKFLLKV